MRTSLEGNAALSRCLGKYEVELKNINKKAVKQEPSDQEKKGTVEPQTRWTLNDMYDFLGPEAMITTFFNSNDAKALGEDTHVDLVFIKTLAASLEARMWASYRTSVASVREHIAFDLQKKPAAACMVNVANDLRLFFCGPIGVAPGKNCHCVCNAFGVDFFMNGTGVDSCSADCLVPAWMAKTSKTPTMEIAFECETIFVDATCKLHDEQPARNHVKLNVNKYFLKPLLENTEKPDLLPITVKATVEPGGKRGSATSAAPEPSFGSKIYTAAMTASEEKPVQRKKTMNSCNKHLLK